jgi:thermitase
MLGRLLVVLALSLLTGSAPAGASPVAHVAGKAKPKHARHHRAKARPVPRPKPAPKPKPATPVAAPVVVPDDPWWGSEWGLERIDMPALWAATAASTGSPAVVAVVDTGVDGNLPDLAGALEAGYGAQAGAGDAVGHGSAVAEVAAARGNDGVGAAGVCWRCRILPVDVAPSGSASGTDLAAGIRFAVDHGANVVNVSLVLSGPDPAVEAAVAYAQAQGVLVVAAAGNDGGTSPTYPAAYSGVLGVVAVDAQDQLYPWSTHGPWAAFAAPGCATVGAAGGGQEEFCGSSAAAPLVSGLAGLLWSSGLSSAAAVRTALAAAAVPVDGSVAAGGRVDARLLARTLSPG